MNCLKNILKYVNRTQFNITLQPKFTNICGAIGTEVSRA